MRLWPRRREEPAAPEPQDLRGLSVEREPVAPGDIVRGSVVVDGADSSEAGMQVTMRFHERSAGYDVVVREIADSEPRREQVPDGTAHRFAIELPADALPTCTSPHGGLVWTLDASDPSVEGIELEVATEPVPADDGHSLP